MKIALYIEDGLEQIVLTPEIETERAILGKLSSDERELSVYRGGFYACAAGWVRHTLVSSGPYGSIARGESTIIVLREKPPLTATEPSAEASPSSSDAAADGRTVLRAEARLPGDFDVV